MAQELRALLLLSELSSSSPSHVACQDVSTWGNTHGVMVESSCPTSPTFALNSVLASDWPERKEQRTVELQTVLTRQAREVHAVNSVNGREC